MIDGSANLFGLCRISFLCLRGNEISILFRWCPEMLSHSLVIFLFGLLLLLLSFHWILLRFGCSFVRPTVSVWRRRLVFRVFWLVLWSVYWSLSLAILRWNFFQSNWLFMIFPFIFPCIGLDVDCPWCSCFIPLLDLCPRALGLYLRGKLMSLFEVFLCELRLYFWPNVLVPNFALCKFLCLRGCGVGLGRGWGLVTILSMGCVE